MESLRQQNAPIFTNGQLKRLIIPLIIEQFLAMTVGMADTVMITSVGEAAVSGVALVDSLSTLIIQVLAALCTGGAVVVSQYIGRQEPHNARTAAKQLVYTATALALFLTVLALTLRKGLLSFLFGSIEADVMASAQIYFLICAISYPFLAIYNAIAALFRSMGNSKVSMFTSLLMNLVNIGGNAILIYGYGWGAAGAATATLVSRILAAGVMLYLIRDHHNTLYLNKLLQIRFQPSMVKNILKIGIPNGLENGMFHIGKLMVQSLVASFGTAAIAANAIVSSVHSFAVVPGSAIGLSLITVIGQCVGAGDYDQATSYIKRLMKLIYLSMGAMNIILFIAGPSLIQFFHLSAEATALGINIQRITALFSIFLWPLAFAFPNVLRAAGDAKFTMMVSMASMWVFRIGMSFVLSQLFHLGLYSTWFAMYLDWVVRCIAFLIRYKSGKWKTKRLLT